MTPQKNPENIVFKYPPICDWVDDCCGIYGGIYGGIYTEGAGIETFCISSDGFLIYLIESPFFHC